MDLVSDVEGRMEWMQGDILDAAFLERAVCGMDRVFHCAAVVTFAPGQEQRLMEVNRLGTARVVDACLFNGVERLIHTSSVAAIGRPAGASVVTENTGWSEATATPYARSKRLAELEARRGMERGLAVSIVNPTIILGVGYWDSGSCKIFDTVGRGLRFYPVGATGFVDVRDVAEALWRASERPEAIGQRYIINGHNVPFKALFDEMAPLLGQKQPSLRVGRLLGGAYWRMEKAKSWLTGRPPLATKDSIHIASLSYSYNSMASVQDLGMAYRPLRETLDWGCVAWLRQNRGRRI